MTLNTNKLTFKEKIRSKILHFLDLDAFVDELVQAKVRDIKKAFLKETKVFQHSGTMTTLVGAEYTIFKVDQPCKFWGFLDIEDFRIGDKVEVKILYKSIDDKYKHYFFKELEGPFSNPVFGFDERNCLGVEVRIRQVAGASQRKLLYNWGWINL